ncbi:MAG: Glu-tRNA(Gln) amidotransferase subunit GatE [Candidatus Micrarchaeota archaeon]
MLCGLEIHQRLAGRKLFHACSAPRPDEALGEGAARVVRSLQATSSEMGGVDESARFEGGRGRKFEYVAPPAFCSLVDLDEEPPNAINPEALAACLRFARSIGANVVDEVQVMRKTIVDGSNTSGFQRTALVALGGKIMAGKKEIPIQTVCLEEESAGILPSQNGRSVYRLDRMGIPLIEIATDPVFTTPQEALDGARAIGLSLRMLPEVMRGLGTIRQDVNISIPEGTRVEIKGLQDLGLMASLIENEVRRQTALIEIAKEIKGRKTRTAARNRSGDGDEDPITWLDVSELLTGTKCKIISKAIAPAAAGSGTGNPSGVIRGRTGVVLAAKLPGYAGLLGRELYEGRRLGTEISDYAKMAGGVSGLIHSDEDFGKYELSRDEIDDIAGALQTREEDAFILIADSRPKAEAAMAAALKRAHQLEVVPETRKADGKGGSSFMRPISGAHRMYPETDIRPIRITKNMLEEADTPLENLETKKERLYALLGAQLGEQMLRSHHLDLFEKLCEKGADARLAAVMLEQTFVALRREGVDVDRIGPDALFELFGEYGAGRLTKAAIPEVLKVLAQGKESAIRPILEQNRLERISGAELARLFAGEGLDMKSFIIKHRLVVDGEELARIANKR